MRQAVSDPSFMVTGVAKQTQDGRELVQVDYIHNYENRASHVLQKGSLWLDPSRCWSIRRSKYTTEVTTGGERSSDGEVDFVCETIDHPSGFPILRSVTEHLTLFQHKSKRKSGGTTKKDYDLEVNDSVPDSEFNLSAFGLPEPGGEESVKKPIPMYIWILLAASVCGALAFTFRYLARRRRLAAAS